MTFLVIACLAVAVVLLAYVLWVKSRRNPVLLTIPDGVGIGALRESFAALTWGRIIDGNRVEIIQDSAFFDAFIEDVGRAQHHIHLETFLWQDGAVSDRVTEALCAAARRSVVVRVLVDQRGSKKTSPAVWSRLRCSGVDFRVFHRARLPEFAWYNHRDHRKVVVIDGAFGYTFGHGVADMWGRTAEHPTGWRDTAARITGPAVMDLQTAFFDNWARTGGVVAAGPEYFRVLPHAGETPVHVAFLAPRETTSAVQRLYHLAIASARQEIILQNPYFIPDRRSTILFAAARRRGVAVTVMLPTATTSDFPIVQHASHFFYGGLLREGVRVFEYTRSGLHQKVMIVDGEWVSVGSTNFDPRSFRLNDEISIGIFDRHVATELRATFERDLAGAEEWSLERWDQRGWRHKATDFLSALLRRQL